MHGASDKKALKSPCTYKMHAVCAWARMLSNAKFTTTSDVQAGLLTPLHFVDPSAHCRRLQALASDGLCWQQPAYQQPDSSNKPRSFWDLSAVEGVDGQQ